MDFRKEFTGKLINIRPESFTDKRTGEIQRFYRVDIVADIDGQPQAVQLTCGDRALSDGPEKFKPGQPVAAAVIPYSRNNRVIPRLVSLSAA